jgi:hypothetical protein
VTELSHDLEITQTLRERRTGRGFIAIGSGIVEQPLDSLPQLRVFTVLVQEPLEFVRR